MFDHLSITASDLDRAQTFYDAILAPLGVPRVNRRGRAIGYGERRHVDGAPCYLSVYLSDKVVPDNRHWCFRAPSRAAVRAFHAAALATAATTGAPASARSTVPTTTPRSCVIPTAIASRP